MKTITGKTFGVDISKDHIDCYEWESQHHRQYANTPAGIKAFIQWIHQAGALKHVVFEASGGYEDLLKTLLEQENLRFWLVDPRLIRYFIKSEGIKAKTDKIDAKMIAQFGSIKEASYVSPPRSEEERMLYVLVERRRQLVEMKQTEATRLKKPRLLGAKENIQAHIDYLTREIKTLDEEIDELCEQSACLKEDIEILESVPGVGLISAASLLSFLPELGKIGNKEIGSLVGVVPYSKQSGRFKGIERISGGRYHPRRVLYMSVLVGIRYNPVIKAYYEGLCGRGKAKKVALPLWEFF